MNTIIRHAAVAPGDAHGDVSGFSTGAPIKVGQSGVKRYKFLILKTKNRKFKVLVNLLIINIISTFCLIIAILELTFVHFQHESICQFPSQHFYEGQLKCGLKEQSLPSPQKFWPNGRNKTFAFCNVIGREETQQVATSDGNEQSKANKSEVHYAVSHTSLTC